MRLLLIHSDHIEYEARKKTKVAEEDAVQKDALDEALAVFCAVESVDEENIEDAIRQATDEVVATARQLGTTNIMIYPPYAHLSSDLASPEAAVSILRGVSPRPSPGGRMSLLSGERRLAGTRPSRSPVRATRSRNSPGRSLR